MAISSQSDPNERDPESIVRRLLRSERELPETARAAILSMHEAAVPVLLEIVKHHADGWSPVHAVRLLGEMRVADAIAPLLRVLAETDGVDMLHDAAIAALPELGESVLEPALRAYAENLDTSFRASVASVLARIGVRDERIFCLLLEILERSPSYAGDLAEYGDTRALPFLACAFDAYEVRDSAFANQDLIELHAAIEELGGTLTPGQAAKYRRALEPAERWRRQLIATLDARSSVPRRTRPGRNEPCWCGSTKKYKKCHLGADNRGTSASNVRT
jgi:HEAT repeat protein